MHRFGWLRNSEWWMVGLNVGAIIIAAIAAALFWGQLRVMRHTLAEMRRDSGYTRATAEAAGQEAKAATRAANAAVASVSAAQAQIRLSERAWLGMVSSTASLPQNGKSLNVTIGVRNSGRTPALSVAVAWHLSMLPRLTALSHGAPLLSIPSSSLVRMAPVPPNGGQQYNARFPFGPEQYAEISAGQRLAYVQVQIRYRDIFGRPHTTDICSALRRAYAPRMVFCPSTRDTMN